MKQGDKVYFTFYGEDRSGKISRPVKSSIVFLIDDKSGKERWMHAASVSLKKPNKESE